MWEALIGDFQELVNGTRQSRVARADVAKLLSSGGCLRAIRYWRSRDSGIGTFWRSEPNGILAALVRGMCGDVSVELGKLTLAKFSKLAGGLLYQLFH